MSNVCLICRFITTYRSTCDRKEQRFKSDHTSTQFAVNRCELCTAVPLRSADKSSGFFSPPQWEEVKHEARSSATVLAKYQENTQERDCREALELASQPLSPKERTLGVNAEKRHLVSLFSSDPADRGRHRRGLPARRESLAAGERRVARFPPLCFAHRRMRSVRQRSPPRRTNVVPAPLA